MTREGHAVTTEAVHFACHGEVSPATPSMNGIILNDNTRLDELYVQGNNMDEPFVFLNACQLGANSELIADYGGMAAAFLRTGCSGFVAPLWNVGDATAREMATTFYADVIDDGVTIAEAIRRRRARFDPDNDRDLTHLAYVYFGHPNLSLAIEGAN